MKSQPTALFRRKLESGEIICTSASLKAIEKPKTVGRIGLLAGSGQYPLHFAQGLKARNYEVVAVAIDLETDPALADEVDSIRWFGIGNLETILEYFKHSGIDEVVFTGKIHKTHMFTPLKLDEAMKRVISCRAQRDDVSLLLAVMKEFDRVGIKVREPTAFLDNLQVTPGVLTQREPTEEDLAHARYGFKIAKELAKNGIGQTVVVKDGIIVAVEAIEGTDQAIRRASALVPCGGLMVVKVGCPNQDRRLDMPVIGIDTIKTLISSNVQILAIDAKNTVLLEKEKLIEQANRHGISIIAL